MVDNHRATVALEVRTRVLAVATRKFAAHGFDGTSLQAIADEVGVTKPAVLHHFPSKEHLRAAVLEGILEHWRDTLPRLLLMATASEGRFDAVFGELYRFFASEPDRARLVVREALDRPAEVKRMLRGPLKPTLDAVAGYIRRGQELGHHFADVDAEAYVLHVLQMVLIAAATLAVSPSALGEGAPARRRYDREAARIAKTSLFHPRPREAPRERRTR